jgi:uncharacterized membrane protein YccC
VGARGRGAGRRFVADLRAGRAFLAGELSQSGWLDFGAFRWHDIAPGRAVRAAFGVITPLVIGVAIGRVEFGSFAALGALPAGFVSFRGVTRSRVRAVVIAAAGMAVSTFIGAWAEGSHPWLLVPAIFALAYLVGLLAALGPTALVVSLQWPVALLVASALPLGPGPAAIRAMLVLAGGLWQGLLVISSWAVNRGGAERAALSGSLRALSEYAAAVAAGSEQPPGPATVEGRQALGDPNPLMRTAARLQLLDLTEDAERIRSSLTAVGMSRTAYGSSSGADLLRAAAIVLAELAEALAGGSPGQRAAHLDAARRPLRGVRAGSIGDLDWAGEALLGQLRESCRIIAALNEAEPARRTGRKPSRRPPLVNRDVLTTLRASVGLSSETGRHALRLAVATAVTEVIVRAAGLPHSYWAVLTVFIVLRPDYSSTLYRGVQRAAGTVVGAGLGVLTVLLGHLGDGALLAGVALSLLAAYAVFTVNYLLYAVFLTDFVVVLLALLGLPADTTAIDRLIGTGVGTGLGLLAYIVWPTWEGTSAAEKFARLFTLQGRYASAQLRAYTRPGEDSAGRRRDLQLTVRRARTDADASADRLAGEPDHPPMTAALARSLIVVGHRIAQAEIALDASIAAHHAPNSGPLLASQERSREDAVLRPWLDALADGVLVATRQLAQAVRHLGTTAASRALDQLPPLRAEQRGLWSAAREPAGAAPGEFAGSADEAAGLLAATDSLVDAINTAADIVREPARSP